MHGDSVEQAVTLEFLIAVFKMVHSGLKLHKWKQTKSHINIIGASIHCHLSPSCDDFAAWRVHWNPTLHWQQQQLTSDKTAAISSSVHRRIVYCQEHDTGSISVQSTGLWCGEGSFSRPQSFCGHCIHGVTPAYLQSALRDSSWQYYCVRK